VWSLEGEDAVDARGGERLSPAGDFVGLGHEQGIDQHRRIVDVLPFNQC
jgi:hypothetical protein